METGSLGVPPDPPSGGRGPELALWRSLYYFNLYRLTVAGLFLFATLFLVRSGLFSLHDVSLARWICSGYFASALFFLWLARPVRLPFNVLLTAEVIADILALALLMYASGGNRSGMSNMLLVVLAGAGLVGQGRLVLSYAALATMAVMGEQGYRMLTADADLADFTHAGIISIAFFATAASARLLALRVVANETLARQRGRQLGEQFRINQRVIREMQEGVLVVDPAGWVRQHNLQAEALCAVQPGEIPTLAEFSEDLAVHYREWCDAGVERVQTIQLPENNRLLRARFLPPLAASDNALIYLEDMERIQEQARQIKLAALGRLTANMAHEIRNPLASISHAAELLGEQPDGNMQQRLVRIIGDNTGRLNRLVTDVLELGGRDRAEPVAINLAGFLGDFVEEMSMVTSNARRAIKIDAGVEGAIWFDHSHLNRVLVNLVGNALRYCSGESGSIRISVRRPDAGARIDLHVSDDGPGIASDNRMHVFEPFFTTRSSGTGLGLYIARELCEANGAVLELMDSAHGAHFRISGRDSP